MGHQASAGVGQQPGLTGAPVAQPGIRALVDAKALEPEQMPMLEVICDRALPALAASMRSLTSEAVEVGLEQIGSARFGELMSHVPSPAMFGVFGVTPLDGHGVMVLEPDLIYALLDALMGGQNGGDAAERPAARGFTSIETGLMAAFIRLVLKEFAGSFALVAPIAIELERSEALPRFATIVGPAVMTARCRFRVDLAGRVGHFALLLPTTTLEPIRERLTQRFLSDTLKGNAAWAEHFDREIRRSTLRVDAILAERTMRLSEVMRLSVGQTLPLGRSAHAPVALRVEGIPMGHGEMGQRSNRVALRLTQALSAEI